MNGAPTILRPIHEEILRGFAQTPESDRFYLTGGTALSAFFLRHRESEDLDLFTSEDSLIRFFGPRMERTLTGAGLEVEVIRRMESFQEYVVGRTGHSVKVQLGQDSPFRLEPTTLTEYGVRLDSLRDVSANKLLALFARAEPRDFADVFFLVQDRKTTLDELLRDAGKKDPGLDPYYLALAFKKAETLPDVSDKLPFRLLRPLDVSAMKRWFVESSFRLVQSVEKRRG